MILNPRQVMNMRLGLTLNPCNVGGKSNTTNQTSNWNSSDTYTATETNNTTTNLSYQTTDNNTNTLTQDRRLVNDGGIGVSADNSTVLTSNSNNTSTVNNNAFAFDSGNTVNSHNTITTVNHSMSTDYGAIAASGQLGVQSVASNQSLSLAAIDASKFLVGTTKDMHNANLSFAQHVSDGGAELAWKLSSAANAESRNAIREVAATAGNMMNSLSSVVAKPLDANNPQQVIIIVGLCVVGLVFFSKMRA